MIAKSQLLTWKTLDSMRYVKIILDEVCTDIATIAAGWYPAAKFSQIGCDLERMSC